MPHLGEHATFQQAASPGRGPPRSRRPEADICCHTVPEWFCGTAVGRRIPQTTARKAACASHTSLGLARSCMWHRTTCNFNVHAEHTYMRETAFLHECLCSQINTPGWVGLVTALLEARRLQAFYCLASTVTIRNYLPCLATTLEAKALLRSVSLLCQAGAPPWGPAAAFELQQPTCSIPDLDGYAP
jgi:hypothetical protein